MNTPEQLELPLQHVSPEMVKAVLRRFRDIQLPVCERSINAAAQVIQGTTLLYLARERRVIGVRTHLAGLVPAKALEIQIVRG